VKSLMIGFCVVMLALPIVRAGAAPSLPQPNASMTFEKLKSLVGEWEAPLPKNEVMTDVFRLIGSGTAILHEEWKGGEQLTATVFYVVESQLRADHYCDLGNQLHYIARSSADPTAAAFELSSGSNLDTHPRHFHSTVWHFIDADHHTQDWELMGANGQSTTIRMEFTRKK
jgi:hypothetical protein